MRRACLALVPLAGVALIPRRTAQTAPPAPSPFDSQVVPFLKAHCLGCHTKGSASAGLEIYGFLKPGSLAKDPESWKHFASKIRSGPVVVAGRGGGALKPGRHLRYAAGTPVTNLYLTLLDRAGVRPEAIGDSTGRVEHLSGV